MRAPNGEAPAFRSSLPIIARSWLNSISSHPSGQLPRPATRPSQGIHLVPSLRSSGNPQSPTTGRKRRMGNDQFRWPRRPHTSILSTPTAAAQHTRTHPRSEGIPGPGTRVVTTDDNDVWSGVSECVAYYGICVETERRDKAQTQPHLHENMNMNMT